MQVSFNYCPTAFDLDLLVYTEMLCKDAVDLNALKEDVFHLAQSKICTTRNLGLSNLVNADYKIKYDNEIQLAEDEEMIDFGSEPYVEDYKIQTSEERCILPDIDILQRELEKMQAELGLKDLVSEEVDLDNIKNSEDNSPQTKFCSSVESASDLAGDKVEEVEEKEEDENSSASEVDLTAEADEYKSADNQVISSSEIEDKSKQGTPFEEEQVAEQEAQEQGTDDFEDEYLDSDILNSIEVIEENVEDSEESVFDFDTSYDEDEDTDFESSDLANSSEDDEDDVDFGSDSDDEDSDFDDFSGFSEDDYEDEEHGISSEDEDDDDVDISFSSEESGEAEDEDSIDFDSDDDSDENGYDFSESDTEDDYDFSESDDDEDNDISSDESDDQPIEESVVYEDEYLDSDIYSNIKILKKVKKKKQGVSEASSTVIERQTTKSKNSSSTLGVETKKAKDSSNVNDSSKSSGSLSKASREVPKGAPSLEKVVEQPKKSEFGSRDEEPKDLRSFLRKHPHCEMSVIYKYFTKKEVQNALLTGKVVKKGTQLHI